jgi:hypothetical protein
VGETDRAGSGSRDTMWSLFDDDAGNVDTVAVAALVGFGRQLSMGFPARMVALLAIALSTPTVLVVEAASRQTFSVVPCCRVAAAALERFFGPAASWRVVSCSTGVAPAAPAVLLDVAVAAATWGKLETV